MFVGIDGDLHPVTQSKLGEDAGNVALDGGLAEVEPAGPAMTIAMLIGTHNLSAVPIILAVIIIGVAIFIMQRRRKPPNGHDT